MHTIRVYDLTRKPGERMVAELQPHLTKLATWEERYPEGERYVWLR